jgi:hypothetical protein
MNESTIQESAIDPTVRNPETPVLLSGVRRVASYTVLMFVNLAVVVSAQSPCPRVHVKILNIRCSTGTIDCALFESPVGFPTEVLRAATKLW